MLDAQTILFWSMVCWRLTALLVSDTITAPIRDKIGVYYDQYSQCQGRNFAARALCCHRCASVWVAALIVLLFYSHLGAALLIPAILAVSAGSILINAIIER